MDSDRTEADVPRGTSPEPVARLVEETVGGWERRECVTCACPFYAMGVDVTECPPCVEQRTTRERLEREALQVVQKSEAWIPAWCEHVGMTKREASATVEAMPAALRRMLHDPRLGVSVMVTGVTPERGFGLMGATGTGKTFALAALLKVMAQNRWLRLAPTHGLMAKKQFARWVRWPEVVAQFRMAAMRDGGHDAVERMVDEWSEVEVLVVDDLGAERVKASYSEEWTSSLLDLVVDRRYNEMRPTWWTANLTPEEFGQRYGSRLWSRLTGQNPAMVVPSVPDLRVVEGSKP